MGIVFSFGLLWLLCEWRNYPGSLELHFPWKFMGDRYISRLASGAAITVRYNPSNPDESVFLMDDQYALNSASAVKSN